MFSPEKAIKPFVLIDRWIGAGARRRRRQTSLNARLIYRRGRERRARMKSTGEDGQERVEDILLPSFDFDVKAD